MRADLYDAISDGNLDDIENAWKPMLSDALNGLRATGPLTGLRAGEVNAQDAHWEWRRKLIGRRASPSWRSFAIEFDGMTQGVMSTRLDAFGRAGANRGLDIVYVDLLASAPWNRYRLVEAPKFGGIGRALLAAAVSLSLEEELAGRTGLHSLPQSESWYRDKCAMSDLGREVDGPYEGLSYFEMTSEQARAFLS
ncbi:hypothetical protein ACLNGM_17045 [Aureimonas phyllosphaerae]|uniref:hypothetical protein n=1 Tax=Aureimonas phyllosphaerae TaxID=1166078 RepID=UPI003A5C3313